MWHSNKRMKNNILLYLLLLPFFIISIFTLTIHSIGESNFSKELNAALLHSALGHIKITSYSKIKVLLWLYLYQKDSNFFLKKKKMETQKIKLKEYQMLQAQDTLFPTVYICTKCRRKVPRNEELFGSNSKLKIQ